MLNSNYKNMYSSDLNAEGLEDNFWDKLKKIWSHLPLISHHEPNDMQRLQQSYIPPSRYIDQSYHTRWD